MWTEEQDEHFCWQKIVSGWLHRGSPPGPVTLRGDVIVESDVDSGVKMYIPHVDLDVELDANKTSSHFGGSVEVPPILDAKGGFGQQLDVAVVAPMASVDKTQ